MTAIALVAACAGPPARVIAPVPLEDYGVAGDDVLCAWAVRCRHVPDEATCRRLLDPRNADVRFVADEVAAGRLAYDPAQGGKCLVEALQAACSAPPFGGAACQGVFLGLVAEGDPCATAAECEAGGACQQPACDAGCCLGTCGAPPAPAPVTVPAPVGGDCHTHTDCVETAYCELDGVCVALPDEPGERCLFGCAWGDLYCHIETETCRRYAGAGEPCGGEVLCDPAWAFCDGVCRPRPGEGEACDDAERRCVAVTFCQDGECAPRQAPGEPCESDAECDHQCDESEAVCVAYSPCPAVE